MDYKKIKYILDGITNIEDGMKINVSEENKNIWKLMVESKIYNKTISFDSFVEILKNLDKINNKEDCHLFITNMEEYFDIAQYNTIKRLINMKPSKSKHKINLLASKPCPHCGLNKMNTLYTTYTICGLSDKGFDNYGCHKDWCFRCGKKLCKEWLKDKLDIETNRKHNGNCCKEYANEQGMDYITDFCQCVNSNVDREFFH